MTSLREEFDAVKHLLPPGLSEADQERMFYAYMAGAFVGLHSITSCNTLAIVSRYDEALRYMKNALGGPINPARN